MGGFFVGFLFFIYLYTLYLLTNMYVTMKNLTCFFLACLLISSCSQSDEPGSEITPPINFDDIEGVKLHVKEKDGNIFEMMEFYISNPDGENGRSLTELYDSIVWTIPEAGRFNIFHHTYNYSHLTSRWGHNFFLPQKYETVLLGYNAGKVISSDTLLVDIHADKDFLGYNWKDIISTSFGSKGYADVLSDGYELVTNYRYREGVPSMKLFIWPQKNEDEATAVSVKEFLLSYMTSLYAAPCYTEEDPRLIEEYENLFRYKEEDALPVDLWITPKSHIVLLEYQKSDSAYRKYQIYAEPAF